jgi:carbon storage regulator
MLVLARKVDGQILLSNGVAITVVGIRGDRVQLGVTAPPAVGIWRGELLGTGGSVSPANPEPPPREGGDRCDS